MRPRILPLSLTFLLLLACGAREQRGRVLVLGLDGMDPQTVDLLMSEGKLPNFAKLRQEGAYGRLLSQKSLLSPIIWTTIATGKGPEEHGIGHFVAMASDTGEQMPATSGMRRVKALWNIASNAGREVATVGWWATWPPEEVHGAVVSDHMAYHFLFEEGLRGGGDGGEKTHPPELAGRIAPLLRRPADLSAEELATFVDVAPEELARPFDFNDDFAHFRWALATAQSYRDVGLELWREVPLQRGLPDGGSRNRHRGPREGARARARQRAVSQQPRTAQDPGFRPRPTGTTSRRVGPDDDRKTSFRRVRRPPPSARRPGGGRHLRRLRRGRLPHHLRR